VLTGRDHHELVTGEFWKLHAEQDLFRPSAATTPTSSLPWTASTAPPSPDGWLTSGPRSSPRTSAWHSGARSGWQRLSGPAVCPAAVIRDQPRGRTTAEPWATPKAWAAKMRRDDVLAVLLGYGP
jgi:hypothetical protein